LSSEVEISSHGISDRNRVPHFDKRKQGSNVAVMKMILLHSHVLTAAGAICKIGKTTGTKSEGHNTQLRYVTSKIPKPQEKKRATKQNW
jgi:hypothetical protein